MRSLLLTLATIATLAPTSASAVDITVTSPFVPTVEELVCGAIKTPTLKQCQNPLVLQNCSKAILSTCKTTLEAEFTRQHTVGKTARNLSLRPNGKGAFYADIRGPERTSNTATPDANSYQSIYQSYRYSATGPADWAAAKADFSSGYSLGSCYEYVYEKYNDLTAFQHGTLTKTSARELHDVAYGKGSAAIGTNHIGTKGDKPLKGYNGVRFDVGVPLQSSAKNPLVAPRMFDTFIYDVSGSTFGDDERYRQLIPMGTSTTLVDLIAAHDATLATAIRSYKGKKWVKTWQWHRDASKKLSAHSTGAVSRKSPLLVFNGPTPVYKETSLGKVTKGFLDEELNNLHDLQGEAKLLMKSIAWATKANTARYWSQNNVCLNERVSRASFDTKNPLAELDWAIEEGVDLSKISRQAWLRTNLVSTLKSYETVNKLKSSPFYSVSYSASDEDYAGCHADSGPVVQFSTAEIKRLEAAMTADKFTSSDPRLYRLYEILKVADGYGCFSGTYGACDWSPKLFEERVDGLDIYAPRMEADYGACVDATGSTSTLGDAAAADFEVPPADVAAEDVLLACEDYEMDETGDFTGNPQDLEDFIEFKQDYDQIYGDFVMCQANGRLADLGLTLDSFGNVQEPGDSTKGGSELGGDYVGLDYSYDMGWSARNFDDTGTFEMEVHGDFDVVAKIMKKSYEIIAADVKLSTVKANDKLTVRLLNASVAAPPTDSEGDIRWDSVIDEDYKASWDGPSLEQTVSVLGIPVKVKAGVVAHMGVEVSLQRRVDSGVSVSVGDSMDPTFEADSMGLRGEVRPYAKAVAFGEAGPDLGILSVSVGGELTIIDVSAPLKADVELGLSNDTSDPFLGVKVSGAAELSALDGSLYVKGKIGLCPFCKSAKKEFFSWEGYSLAVEGAFEDTYTADLEDLVTVFN